MFAFPCRFDIYYKVWGGGKGGIEVNTTHGESCNFQRKKHSLHMLELEAVEDARGSALTLV